MQIDYGYLCENLGHLSGLQVRVYQGTHLIHEYVNLPFAPDPVSLACERIQKNEYTVCYYDILSLVFLGAIRIPASNISIVVGPTSQLRLDNAQLTAILRQLGEGPERVDELAAYFKSVPCYPLENFLHILCFVNYALNNEKLTVRDLIEQETSFLRLRLEPQKAAVAEDDAPIHNTLEMEKRLLSYITAGQPEALSALFEKPPIGRVGKIAHSEMRQRKNTFVISATLASRAAIAGGMQQDAAFSMSDLYIQKAEMLNDHNQLTLLNMEMLLTFAGKVQEVNCHGSRSRFSTEIARYVSANINRKQTTADIATYMKMNRNHLCERFKKETGVTLNTFITEQKMVEAKRLLASTEQSILQISDYLSYSSQGYFQNVFKKQVGCTPHAFRLSQ